MPDPLQLKERAPGRSRIWRLQRLGSLAAAAGCGDDGHSELIELGKELDRAINRWDSDRIPNSLSDIRPACEDL
jgi:hypothetical protein